MTEWSFEEYLNSQIQKIKKLKEKGYTVREILDKNIFWHEVLRPCDIPITCIVSQIEVNEMNF